MVCPDCGHEISDAALVCIHCGRPRFLAPPEPEPEPRKPRPWGDILTALGGLALAGGMGLLLTGRTGFAAALVSTGLACVFVGAAYSIFKRFRG